MQHLNNTHYIYTYIYTHADNHRGRGCPKPDKMQPPCVNGLKIAEGSWSGKRGVR